MSAPQAKQATGVAPYTGAWIEISAYCSSSVSLIVAPYTGAWIEIQMQAGSRANRTSLPTRERGLKLKRLEAALQINPVAPYTGAWIEIIERFWNMTCVEGRSLHGSVD